MYKSPIRNITLYEGIDPPGWWETSREMPYISPLEYDKIKQNGGITPDTTLGDIWDDELLVDYIASVLHTMNLMP